MARNSDSARKVCLLLNRKAGTARGSDIESLTTQIAAPFKERGDHVEVRARAPKALGKETARLNNGDPFDLIVIGGGDGTLSRCAQDLADNPATLGFLPLGTMNLFARALGLPTDIQAAAEAIAGGTPGKIDVGRINGQLYLHHVSFGLHPSLVRQREEMTHRSRAGKIVAGMRAFWLTVRAPKVLNLAIETDGATYRKPSSAIVISNNPFGDGHLPYADKITSGKLGVYICRSFDPPSLMRLGAETMLGRLNENPDIDTSMSDTVTLTHTNRKSKKLTASIDGELTKIALPGHAEILRSHLNVMLPAQA